MSGAEGQTSSPFKRFRLLARKLVAVPKAEVKERKALGAQRKPPTPKLS